MNCFRSRKVRSAPRAAACLPTRVITLDQPHERTAVIDDDPGKSRTFGADSNGFKRVIGEVGLSKAGFALSLDAPCYARSDRE